MASNEDTVREERLRRRETKEKRDRLRRQTESVEERDARFKLISQLSLYVSDRPDAEVMIGVDVLL